MHRIQLENTEFEGANAVYVLGADEAGPTTLVDSATAQPDVQTALADGLSDARVSLTDVDQVLLTHFHGDHAGGAGAIQAATDAVVRVHEADAPLVAREETPLKRLEARHEELFTQWGMPADAQAELRSALDDDRLWSSTDAVFEPFTDGDRFQVGERAIEVSHLPGHTLGQSGFVLDDGDERALFSGDALLPKYTPNVGGADVRADDALAAYLDSLVRIVEGDFNIAYPGHRTPIHNPGRRATRIIDHHRTRTERIVGVLSNHGPMDAWTVSAHLFGELDGIHVLHGPGEAYAHLEHLRDAGTVVMTNRKYELVGDPHVPDLLFPSVD